MIYGNLYIRKGVCRLGLSAFSKIFDFVKNVWFPISQQKKFIKSKQDRKQNVSTK